jgi:hypothetical protein
MQDCDQIKEAYMHDYLIQIDLSATNGMALKREDAQPKKTIANVFLKFAYTDMDGLMLTSTHNKQILDELLSKLEDHTAKCTHTGPSSTFTPYFDITIRDSEKADIEEVAVSTLIRDKVKNYQLQSNFKPSRTTQATLIKHVPRKSEKSEILNDIMISGLVEALPSMIKMADWQLVYSLNRDGISMLTFFDKCKPHTNTFLVVQDFQGRVFGGYCNEPWKISSTFYGTGENFLFTFKDPNVPTVYHWTGCDDQFQWANSTSLGLGGGAKGRFGLFIKDSLYKGSSSKTSTFENEILSTEGDFIVTMLEVWSLEG